MLRFLLISYFFIGLLSLSLAQDQLLNLQYAYRSTSNTHYWKNRPPHPGYWQQDVHYKIEAEIIDSLTLIDGKVFELTYWNNSPFPLNELYFHLHENAFQPGSHYHNLNENNKMDVTFGSYEKNGLGTVVSGLKVNNQLVKTELDNTILKVILPMPMMPNDSVVISCSFKTFWDTGSMRRRNKTYKEFNLSHFDGVHWYPIIAVYDQKFGWTTDQHLDKEFYANFGSFDVALTFPQEYVVEATGTLQNASEVMPDSLRAKLDLKNFANKPFNEPPSVITPRVKGKTKTWRYSALNVHNFAFTADPAYRIGELDLNGVKIITLAQEQHASKWQKSGWFTREVMKIYSKDFGKYDWPKVIVADAKDGMEYSMLTLDNGTYPQHQGLLAHEVGHMWFYGMVGSNETYRASLDEGFTQFLTVWSMSKIVGEKRDRVGSNWYIDRFLDSTDTRYESLYYPYLNHVVEGFDEPLNTHSSGFNGALRHGGNYGLVYYKTGVMLYNLRYVLGDSLFLNAMKHYVQKWKFAHPYPEDFRQSIIEYTQTDLNWFFDQWLETTKYIDYSIDKVKRIKSDSASLSTYTISFKRLGRMQMPIDFTVTTKDAKQYQFHIPNTWFVNDSLTKTVLPKWYGWDLLHPTYKATINIPGILSQVEIDPSHFLADADLTNNSWGGKGISTVQFDHRIPAIPNWTKQRNYLRPDLWYNSVDGIQVGVHIEGNYFKQFSYASTLWGNTTLGNNASINYTKAYIPFAYTFSSRMLTNRVWNQSSLHKAFSYYGGITTYRLSYEKIFRTQDQRNPRFSKLFITAKGLYNHTNFDAYLLYPTLWGSGNGDNGQFNNSLTLGYTKNYAYKKGSGFYTLSVRSPFINSSINYSWASLVSQNQFALSKFEIRSRMMAQVGFSNNYPLESALMLSGANSEELLENKYTRADGFVPSPWLGYGAKTSHFHMGGGLNLRGYSGYYAVENKTINGVDSLFQGYYSNSGASWNVEVDFDKFIKLKPKGIAKNMGLDTYLFSDMGVLAFPTSTNERVLGRFRMNAGLGSSLAIKFTPYQLNPLVIRVDFPLFLNAPPLGEEYFKFRYVIGINRTF